VETKTKQRMIGIIIIILILLLLIPLLFNKSKNAPSETMPANPEQQMTTEQQPNDQMLPGVEQPNPNMETPVNNGQLPPNVEQPSAATEQPPINNDQLPPNAEQQPPMMEQPVPQQPSAPSLSPEPLPPSNSTQSIAPNQHPATPPSDQTKVESVNAPSQAAVPALSNNEQGKSTITDSTKTKSENKVTIDNKKNPKPVTISASKQHQTKISANKTTISQKKWSVQLGVFAEKSNANQLLNKLKKGGYEAHLKELVISGDKVYRIFVGNNYNQNKAQKIAKSIEKRYNLKGVVVHN